MRAAVATMSGSSARGVSQAFERAVMLHQSGQMAEAERADRQIINTKPDHTEALHLFGILRFQQGHADQLLEWIARSLKVEPRHAKRSGALVGEPTSRARPVG